jgi:hypothetical protein|tara:strand:+ start:543 stop:758 length:216 start_codon:yes stop_codon:yes gene_type:complete
MIDDFVNKGIINSYKLIVGKTLEEVLDKDQIPVFLFPPEEGYDNEDLDTMIDYFISTEEYEKCALLTKLKK